MEGWIRILVYLSLGGLGGLFLMGGFIGVIDGRLVSRNLGLVLLGLGTILTVVFGDPKLVSSILSQLR